MYGKIQTVIRRFPVRGYVSKIWAFSSSLVILRFSAHNFFEARVLLKIFDAEFPYKLSYSLCLLAKAAAKTREKAYFKIRPVGALPILGPKDKSCLAVLLASQAKKIQLQRNTYDFIQGTNTA